MILSFFLHSRSFTAKLWRHFHVFISSIPRRKIKLMCVWVCVYTVQYNIKWDKITYWNKMNWHKWISTFTFFYHTQMFKAQEKQGDLNAFSSVFKVLLSIRHTFTTDKTIILFDMQLCFQIRHMYIQDSHPFLCHLKMIYIPWNYV